MRSQSASLSFIRKTYPWAKAYHLLRLHADLLVPSLSGPPLRKVQRNLAMSVILELDEGIHDEEGEG